MYRRVRMKSYLQKRDIIFYDIPFEVGRMKRKQPIYVATKMNTTMGKLWEYTQEPAIHTEWDARFTEISYLEKKEGEPQKFWIDIFPNLFLKIDERRNL